MHDHSNKVFPMILVKIPDFVFVAITAMSATLLVTPDKLLELKEFVGIAGVIVSLGIQAWKAYSERQIKREIAEIKMRSLSFENERSQFRQEIRQEVEEIKKQVSNE